MDLDEFLPRNPGKEIARKESKEMEQLKDVKLLGKAFYLISSSIHTHQELDRILELAVKEAFSCLKAHRSTIFLIDENSGNLTTRYTIASHPLYQHKGVNEEKEVAWKTIKQNKPHLLQGPAVLPESVPSGRLEGKISSLVCVPLSSRDKPSGVLSAVLMEKPPRFDELDLWVLSSFANLVSVAMKMTCLNEDIRNAETERRTYERYVDDILYRLQGGSKEEARPLPSPEEKLSEVFQEVENEFEANQDLEKGAWVQGAISLQEQPGIERRQDERVEIITRVALEDDNLGFTQNISRGGAFIQTPDPMELGDEFRLKIYIPDRGEPMEVDCKVVWTNKYGKEDRNLRRGMGVKFLNLEPEAKKRIEDHIAHVASGHNAFLDRPGQRSR